MAGPAFDTYVAVDWSAASRPTLGADSIWIATRTTGRGDGDLRNHATRAEAMDALRGIVDRARGRVLIAIDVPLGYPAGTAALLGRAERDIAPWRWTWELLDGLVRDDGRNRNDRFEVAATLNRRIEAHSGATGPFWGHPHRQRVDGLSPTRPPLAHVALPVWRRCELQLRAEGLRPFSAWQIAYAGSVGGQALTAIPWLHRFVVERPETHVWPFTTAGVVPAALPRDAVVLAELWPSAFAFDRARHPVKDAAQVLHVVDELAAADADDRLDASWDPVHDLEADVRHAVLGEEGWILRPRRTPGDR